MAFFETSARSGHNVHETFIYMAKQIKDKQMKQGTTGVVANGGTTPNSKSGGQPEGTRLGGNDGTKLGNSKVGGNKDKKGCC